MSIAAMEEQQRREYASKPVTPYKVVSNKTENILRRDLETLDKQQSYVLRRMDREQRAFKRSLDSLQSQRNRSIAPQNHSHLLKLPGYGAASLVGGSPLMSRHAATNGTASNSGLRSISAGVPSPQANRKAMASRSRHRVAGGGAPMSSPSTERRKPHSSLSPLATSSSTPVAKSWTGTSAWKRPPTGLMPFDASDQKASSTGNIRDADMFELPSVTRPDHHQHSLPPLVGSTSPSQTSSSTDISVPVPQKIVIPNGSGLVPQQNHVRPPYSKPPIPSIPNTVAKSSPKTQRAAVLYAGDSDGESNLAGSRIRLVKSQHLFKDLSTSLPRITTSRPGTAVLTANPDDAASALKSRLATLSCDDTDGIDSDGEVICNGIEEDATMGINAQDGKPLAKLMDEIKGCRYIRHYSSGKAVEDSYDQDAVKKIFASAD